MIGQFSTNRRIALEDGVADDIHEFTGGHAGLVCACGRALESVVALRVNDRITLAAWLDFRVRRMVEDAMRWRTIARMAESVQRMPPLAPDLLERALQAGNAPLVLAAASLDVKSAAHYLAAEGWLLATEPEAVGADVYRITSPLVRAPAMRQLASERPPLLPAGDLPLDELSHNLDMPAVISAVLPYFKGMQAVPAIATRRSTVSSAVTRLRGNQLVATEATYHYNLFLS